MIEDRITSARREGRAISPQVLVDLLKTDGTEIFVSENERMYRVTVANGSVPSDSLAVGAFIDRFGKVCLHIQSDELDEVPNFCVIPCHEIELCFEPINMTIMHMDHSVDNDE